MSEPLTSGKLAPLAEVALSVARLALEFGEIDRTAVFHADGVTPEDDAEHTVMLGWLAPALAERWFPDLDTGLVASFALLHDMPEVYAGDTPTLRITPEERARKAQREMAAITRIFDRFVWTLPWIADTLMAYERQTTPEVRFVKAVDKLLPKLVHLIDQGAGLREHRVTRAEFEKMAATQRASLEGYASDFPALLDLHKALCARVLASVTFFEEVA